MQPLADVSDLDYRLANHPLGGTPLIRGVRALRTSRIDLPENLMPRGEPIRFFCLEVALELIEGGANCKRVLEFCRGIRLMLQGKHAWLASEFPSLSLGLEGIHSELNALLQSYRVRSRSPEREIYARRALILRPVVKALEEALKHQHCTGSLDWS
jgi:hypothetical protein